MASARRGSGATSVASALLGALLLTVVVGLYVDHVHAARDWTHHAHHRRVLLLHFMLVHVREHDRRGQVG